MFPDIFPVMTASARKRALTNHRQRLKRRGVARLEVRVRKEDIPLVKRVVEALGDPERARETRALLRERISAVPAVGLKEWLASAPLEGIELSRDRDMGRDIEL
jgi:hypothetical protein